jgi:hypothetical protein
VESRSVLASYDWWNRYGFDTGQEAAHMGKLLGYLRYGPSRPNRPLGLAATAAFVIGALLVLWTAYIHFHLWTESYYRHQSVIGPLFLAQAIGGLLIAIALVAVRRVWMAVVGAGFGLSTLVGFLLTVSLPKGLFNFTESWLVPFAQEAFGIEVALTVVLLAAGALCLAGSAPSVHTGSALPGHAPSSA